MMSTIQDILFLRALEEENIAIEGFSSRHDIPFQINNGVKYPFVFPKSFIKEVEKLDYTKKYDYFFAGTIKGSHRQFLLDWDKPNSLILTSTKNNFIHPNNDPSGYYGSNFFNYKYFQQLANTNFALCPGGCSMDGNTLRWTYRFWEATLAKAIPITDEPDPAWHTDYKFYNLTDNHIYRQDWVDHNFKLTLDRHFIWT